MFLENGYATMKKHRSVSNRKIPRVHKRKMEEIHDKCDKGGAGSVIKKAAFEKAAGQNYDQRSDDRLRHQPDGVLLSFKDIYDLVEWSCLEDATQALQGKKTYETWQEGLQQIFEAVLENKPFIMNVYHSVSREQIETYLFHLTHDLLYGVVQEKAKGTGISEADQSFIADFYKYSFTGVMLDWIKDGMKVDYHMIAEKMHRTMEGNVVNSIRNFEKRNKI